MRVCACMCVHTLACSLFQLWLLFKQAREGRRLKEFLEDYDDLRDDPKFYK